jgi:hypothetical protein
VILGSGSHRTHDHVLLFDGSGSLQTLRVFQNWVLKRIFGPKRDEVIGGWRKLHNEELHNLYSSLSIIRMIKYDIFTCFCRVLVQLFIVDV